MVVVVVCCADAYFPIADLVVPKLDNLQSEAAVRALSVQQMQMVLESHGHDGASDSRDERILVEYVVQLWQQLMEPSDPSPDACKYGSAAAQHHDYCHSSSLLKFICLFNSNSWHTRATLVKADPEPAPKEWYGPR